MCKAVFIFNYCGMLGKNMNFIFILLQPGDDHMSSFHRIKMVIQGHYLRSKRK